MGKLEAGELRTDTERIETLRTKFDACMLATKLGEATPRHNEMTIAFLQPLVADN
jgi:hypothetical protein